MTSHALSTHLAALHAGGTNGLNNPVPPGISVVAPCCNEEAALPEFHHRVTAACEKLGVTFEIVLINDGSHDGTWDVMQALAARSPQTLCVNLSRNHGHQLALTAGLHICTGVQVLVLDADLQDPPELLGEMMALMEKGADVVYGQRRRRAGESDFKVLSAAAFYRLIERLSDTPIPRDTGDFRLISRRALNVLLSMPERHRFIRGMVSWIGFHQEPILYDRDPRYAGQTKYPLRKMIAFALDAITAFSVKPLRLASAIGFASALVSVGLMLYSLYSWLFLKAVPGWTSSMIAITLLSSIQLFVLGIIGEYLGRLYDQSKGRPLFIIESIVRGPVGVAHASASAGVASANEAPPPDRPDVSAGSAS